jgi:Flp pilus assembly pilin Flp
VWSEQCYPRASNAVLLRELSLNHPQPPFVFNPNFRGECMEFVRRLWSEQEGQDIAEYAVMLAVILVIVVGTVRLIGSNANNVFSNVASSIQ